MCRRSQRLEMIEGGPALAACLLALSLLRRVPGGCPGACYAAAAAAAAACKALTVLFLPLFPLSLTSLSLGVPGARQRCGRAPPRLREQRLRRQVQFLSGFSFVARIHHGLAFNDAENWKTGGFLSWGPCCYLRYNRSAVWCSLWSGATWWGVLGGWSPPSCSVATLIPSTVRNSQRSL